jgi:hypothetical protein
MKWIARLLHSSIVNEEGTDHLEPSAEQFIEGQTSGMLWWPERYQKLQSGTCIQHTHIRYSGYYYSYMHNKELRALRALVSSLGRGV